MSDSDEEYHADSDDDFHSFGNDGAGSGHATRSTKLLKGDNRGVERDGKTRKRRAWEEVQRAWDNVVEGEDGTLTSAIDGLLEAEKRQRVLRDTTPLQRGIIRHLLLLLDLSAPMAEKDLRPTRYLLTLRYTTAFIKQFFEQNPISQLGIIGLKDGLAHLLSPLSGNPADHITALQKLRLEEPLGNPSLQNALEMARAQLFHAPSHGTREALIISGALLSSDPGDIHVTIAAVANDHIRVSAIGLAAQVAILEEMCKKTGGEYSIAMHEEHFRSLYMHFTTPPPTRTKEQSQSSLLMMGFPSRTVTKERSLCACHSKLSRSGYLCSRCGSKVCSLPAECPACGLTLILSTHLARSYHHLFPLRNWREVPWAEAVDSEQAACYACQTTFPLASVDWKAQAAKAKDAVQERKLKAASESSRYACTVCHKHFCIECDLFAHEVVHNCPGCQSDTRPKLQQSQAGGNEMVNGHQNSNGTANGELYGRQS